MQVGLLWFDNDPHRGLTSKIEDAARHYQEKFGRLPNTCYVNRLVVNNGPDVVSTPSFANQDLRVVPAAKILPHHFWVGEEGERDT